MAGQRTDYGASVLPGAPMSSGAPAGRYTAAVLTISDKGYRGQRVDTSGPALCEILQKNGWEVVYTALLPDEGPLIQEALVRCSDVESIHLVLTTGGTGFSPRDVTPEATLAVTERQVPGIPEAMRAESMRLTPRGCLSRAAAGIRGRTLIVNLPGSERAARENLLAVLEPIRHGVEMLRSDGSADCAQRSAKQQPPSLDTWLREARSASGAAGVGMYLTHCGVVRESARAEVRDGRASPPVREMRFSFDQPQVDTAIAEAHRMEGIRYVKVWLNQGTLQVGDDLMRVLIGGDIRPHVTAALDFLVGRLKSQCVTEEELF